MRIYCLSLSLSLVATTTFAIGTAYGEAPVAQNEGLKQTAASQTANSEEVASAQGGVHLLEHILQRMRNLPQLAISKTKQTIAYQGQAQSALYEPNQAANLLIKPKDLTRALKGRVGSGAIASGGVKAEFGGGLIASRGVAKAPDAFGSGANEPATSSIEKEQGTTVWERQEPAQGADANKIANLIPGIGRVREYAPNEQEEKSFKDERNKRIISTAPLITEFPAPQALPQSFDAQSLNAHSQMVDQIYGSNATGAAKVALKKAAPFPGAYLSPPPPPQSGVTAREGYMAGARIDDARMPQMRAPQLDGAANVQGKLAKHKTGALPATRYSTFLGAPGDTSYDRKMASLNRLKADVPGRDLEIALTPPTVITGITLVRLGNSEREAGRAIASLGKTHKESIHGWSVWSVYKHDCKDCAIQVFIRHGIVEAIRIFDPSLLRPELGVTLGDCLSAVKEKFGEPAFILSESTPATTQNYIYPISQIGFQLARNKQNDVPKIVSMIVFNVK